MKVLRLLLGLALCCATVSGSGAQTGCLQPPTGAVAWWPGDGTASDIIGGNQGSPQGVAAYSAGKVGAAFSFTGSNAIVVADSASLGFGTSDLTLEVWINALPNTNTQVLLSKQDTVSPYPGLTLWMQPSGQVGFNLGNCGSTSCGYSGSFFPVLSPTRLDDGVWHHIAATRTATNLQLFVDGQLATNQNRVATSGDVTSPLFIGQHTAAGTYRYTGLLDELAFYKRVLSASEIAAIYAAGIVGVLVKFTFGDAELLPFFVGPGRHGVPDGSFHRRQLRGV